ncbi:MAG: phytanoyl-CoA dioxygenase family protein [Cyanobacteria bacterium P01_E01_bin.6]
MKIAEQFDDRGYAVVRKLFSQNEIDYIAGFIDCIYQQWLCETGDAVSDEQLINMHSLTSPKYFEGRDEERIRFFEAIAPQKLSELIESMFGDGIYLHNTQLFVNPHQGKKNPCWHRDLQYSPIDDSVQAREQKTMLTLHIRIPLVSEKGVELVPYTHKRWDSELEKQVRFELNGHTNYEQLPGTVLIELEPGDVLIFSAQMIHRGNYILNPIRKALDLCVGKHHPLTSKFIDVTMLPSPEEIGCIRNNQWYVLAREIALMT